MPRPRRVGARRCSIPTVTGRSHQGGPSPTRRSTRRAIIGSNSAAMPQPSTRPMAASGPQGLARATTSSSALLLGRTRRSRAWRRSSKRRRASRTLQPTGQAGSTSRPRESSGRTGAAAATSRRSPNRPQPVRLQWAGPCWSGAGRDVVMACRIVRVPLVLVGTGVNAVRLSRRTRPRRRHLRSSGRRRGSNR